MTSDIKNKDYDKIKEINKLLQSNEDQYKLPTSKFTDFSNEKFTQNYQAEDYQNQNQNLIENEKVLE